jgi:hypothetical protein
LEILPGYGILEDVNTVYTISGIKTDEGKVLIIEYNINGESVIKNTVDFRFIAAPPGP